MTRWQDYVLSVISRAQIVLLQIAPTEGTWWEFEQCVQKLEPNSPEFSSWALLQSLPAHTNVCASLQRICCRRVSPRDFGKGRVRLVSMLDWTPHMMEPVYTSGIHGFFNSFEIDLQSLQPFLQRLPQEIREGQIVQRQEGQ